MAYRNIYVSKKSYLSLKDSNIKLIQEEENIDISIPIEDVLAIVLDDKETILTQRFITACSTNDVILYLTDDKHLPVSWILPISNFSRPLIRLLDQINMSDLTRNQFWKKLVQQKIINQASVLEKVGNINYSFLLKVAENVKTGDKTFQEGFAAAYYFTQLFGEDFNRDLENSINFYLNYGYALVRGMIARTLAAYGFNCALGIHHKNQYNAFNLVDDFIEPLRPIVDLFVIKNLDKFDSMNNTSSVKKELMKILNQQMLWKGERHRINTVIDRVAVSFVSAIESKDIRLLKLPEIIDLREHKYEI